MRPRPVVCSLAAVVALLTLATVGAVAADGLSLATAGPLAIRSVECVTDDPSVGRSCELSADLSATWDDPFDPGDIAVTARVQTPSRSYDLPAFYHVPFERRTGDDADEVAAGGQADWRVRFLPTEPGEHRVSLTVRDRSGEVGGGPLSVNVAPADWRGLLRVSERNRLALAWDSGEAFYPLGINVFDRTKLGAPLPPDRIDLCADQIEKLGAAGGNFIRLRMDSWWLAIDNPPDSPSGYLGAGRFNQRACWDIDRLFDLCERGGVQVMLCLENANANVNGRADKWRAAYNVYAAANGGPCQEMADFWTDQTAREIIRRKIRYCVARWGASPALGAWEFFNEVAIGGEVPADPVIAWHAEMAAEFKRLDPHRRLVTTSPMGERDPNANRRLWELTDLDIAQVHDYGHLDPDGIYHTAQDGATRFGKPFIVGEFGIPGGLVRSGRFKYADDSDGIAAHIGRWAVAMSTGAGALDWYVKSNLQQLDLWSDFTRLAAFTADLPRDDPELAQLQVRDVTVGPGVPLDEPGDVTIAPAAVWGQSPHERYVILDDGTIEPTEGLNGHLWGVRNHRDLRRPPTFVVSYPGPGRFVAHVIEVVGRGANPVRITVDGEVALEEDLVCEEGATAKWEARGPGPDDNLAIRYNRDLAVDVPAGEHEISVENLGRDRLTVMYRFEGCTTREVTPEVMVVGLVHGGGAHLWLHNRTWTPEALLGYVTTALARQVRVSLSGLPDGLVQVEWSDPMTGEALRSENLRVTGGALVLDVGDIARDLACKVRAR